MSTIGAITSRGLLLHDVDWRTYSRILRAFGERPSVFCPRRLILSRPRTWKRSCAPTTLPFSASKTLNS